MCVRFVVFVFLTLFFFCASLGRFLNGFWEEPHNLGGEAESVWGVVKKVTQRPPPAPFGRWAVFFFCIFLHFGVAETDHFFHSFLFPLHFHSFLSPLQFQELDDKSEEGNELDEFNAHRVA
jgi:hypothetical protein